jgi:hypothetical protein
VCLEDLERRELYARCVADQAKRRTKAAHILIVQGIRKRAGGNRFRCQAFHKKCTVHSQDFNRLDTIRLTRSSGGCSQRDGPAPPLLWAAPLLDFAIPPLPSLDASSLRAKAICDIERHREITACDR